MTATLTQFVTELRAFGDGPSPEPTPELDALLGGSALTALAGRRRQRHPSLQHRALIIGAVASAVITGTGVAAATDTLPQPAQRFVSGVVNDLTPFHLNAPGTERRKNHRLPTAPAAKPSPATEDSPTPAGEASGSRNDDGDPTRNVPGSDAGSANGGPGSENSDAGSENDGSGDSS